MMTDTTALVQRLRDMAWRFRIGYTERFERDAEAFYAETRLMAPGKSMPAALWTSDSDEKRQVAWDAWIQRRNDENMAALDNTADLLSQERTCSTCRHYGAIVRCALLVTPAPRSILQYPPEDHFGCSLWEQADPKEGPKP